MSILKSEKGVNMEISNNTIKIDFTIGGNVRLINERYNPVRKEDNAIAIEWMIRGEEALKDFFVRIGLRYDNNLGKKLRDRLRSDLKSIYNHAEKISKNSRENSVPFKNKPLKDKDIEVTVKWVRGRWRDYYPSVNVVIPFSECTKRLQKYYWKLTFDEAIEIGYKILYWLSATEISESKGPKTAEGILGKIE